jgi:hypothetical protein
MLPRESTLYYIEGVKLYTHHVTRRLVLDGIITNLV